MQSKIIPPLDLADRLLNIKQLMGRLKVSKRSVWRMVKIGRLPTPLYPMPRCPRWLLSTIAAILSNPEAWRKQPSCGA